MSDVCMFVFGQERHDATLTQKEDRCVVRCLHALVPHISAGGFATSSSTVYTIPTFVKVLTSACCYFGVGQPSHLGMCKHFQREKNWHTLNTERDNHERDVSLFFASQVTC